MATTGYAQITITEITSISNVDIWYAKSSDPANAPTTGWSTDAPSWENGKYIWQKIITTYDNGSVEETDPVCITGEKGETGGKGDPGSTGATGRGVVSITEEYYLSTSDSNPTGGSWKQTQDPYESGKFYWVRSKIVWSNPTETTYAPSANGVLAKGINDANKTASTANSTANTAKTTADNAKTTADTAKSTADTAKSTADTAKATADSAKSIANTAKTTADGKNSVFYNDASNPPTGNKANDIWFKTASTGAYTIMYWTGTQWSASPLDGGVAIKDASITNAKIFNLDGNKITANTITANQLASDAIKSTNYVASSNTNSVYSVSGTFINLADGNIYTPNFGVLNNAILDGNNQIVVPAGAYINGNVVATSGMIGDDANTSWEIGSFTDYNTDTYGSIISHGDAFIQAGNWMISNDLIDTRKYAVDSTSGGQKITYLKNGSTYWDFGMHAPNMVKTSSRTTFDDSFIYIRKHDNTIPSLDSDWNYIFRVSKDGMIYLNGVSLDEKYASIDGVGGTYLPLAGGTISGNLTVQGTLNATASNAAKTTGSLSINGKSFNGKTDVSVGTIGVGYGGTGKTSWTANRLIYTSSTSALSELAAGTSGYILKSNGTSAPSWVSIDSFTLSNYVPTSGGSINGALDVKNSLSADSITAGDLIVNGSARFLNAIIGDLNGHASSATKVDNNLVIKLNSGTTEGTNMFTYNGATAKTVNVTPSAIGAAASSHTHSYAGSASAGGPASYVTIQNTNELNIQGMTSIYANTNGAVYINYRDAATNAASGRTTALNYYFGNGNSDSGKRLSNIYATTFYGDLSGNATTATGDSDGNKISTTYLKKSGGVMTGSISRAGVSTNWNKGRDNALIKTTSLSGYSPLWSAKTNNGSWDVGTYDNNSFTDDLVFTYITDTNYANSNTTTAQIKFLENGHIVASLDGNATSATTVNGHTVNTDVPSGALFTDTKYSAGTGMSLSGTEFSLANNYGDTKNPYASKTKSYVLAAPSDAAGVPSFRALVAADIPNLAWSKITSGNDDLKAIEALTGTSGLLRKTAANTWELDTTTYLTTHQTVTNKGATLSWGSATTVATIGSTNINVSLPANPDTHYNAYLYNGSAASGSNATANKAVTSGNVYLNLVENGSVRSSHKLVPGNGLTITSGTNGDITFNSPDALTGVEAVQVTTDGVTKYVLRFTHSGNSTPIDVSTENIAVVQSEGSNKLVSSTEPNGINVGGSTTKPVYFLNGVPKEVTSIPASLISGTVAPSSHTHAFIVTEGDNRTVSTTPNSYSSTTGNRIIFKGLKQNSAINSPASNSYSYLVGLRGWSDSSGGNAHEIAFNDTGVFLRQGATTTWGNWEKVVTSNNYTDYTVKKDGTGASGTWGINVSGSAGSVAWSGVTSRPTTLGGYGITDAVQYMGNLTSLGSGTPAAATQTYWVDHIPNGTVSIAYNSSGTEYSIIFSRGGTAGYGSILKWGYSTKYLYMLRRYSNNWTDTDWVKVDAGYADTAGSATKATQDSDGNTISSSYLKLSGGTVTGITQFNTTIRDKNGQHVYGGAANRSQWYKITLAHNGVTPPSSAQWYMCSMTIHVAGDYNDGPRGTIELCYYIYWDGTTYSANKVYATGYGPRINKVAVCYNLSDPFIIYVDSSNQYTSIWVDHVSYRDSAQAHNTKETKVEATSAITVSDYTSVKIASIYTTTGSQLYSVKDFYPAYDNAINLGTSDYKWANVYATTFNGTLNGNAATATNATNATNASRSTLGKQLVGFYSEYGQGYDEAKRAKTANINSDNYGGLKTFIATGQMTTGKPKSGDGHIIHLDWDNSDNWASQIAISNNNGIIEHRAQTDVDTWSEWYKVYSEANKPTKSDVGLGNVENTALSTWAGSSKITTVGTITSGTWNGSIIPISKGGTGTDTANSAANAFLTALPTWTATPTDSTYLVRRDTSGSAAYGQVTFKTVYDYIKGKADSVYLPLTGGTLTGNLQGTNIYASGILACNTANSSTAGGLALYSNSPTAYGIAMRGSGDKGTHGYATGDWHIYSFMSGADGRGWIFRNSNTAKNVASISNVGNAQFDGKLRLGGNTGCQMEYDSTLEALVFSFG